MTLPERRLSSELAESWIRECVSLHPDGAQLTLTGSCMEPALREGSLIRLRPPHGPVRVGDVVLLRTPAGLRLHRVVLRLGTRLRTKGDRGTYLDPAGSSGDVIAAGEANESPVIRFLRVALSLMRLGTRSWMGPSRKTDDGDAAHARFLA